MLKKRAVPMIHVPDVLATVEWYKNIGFKVDNTYGNDADGFSFAVLSFGDTQVMFNQGGSTSEGKRREVDLYVYTDGVDQLYEELKEKVDVIERPHNTFYGMREFIFRDLNRFWITFAQVSVFIKLLSGVQENDIEAVRTILAQETLKPQTLTSALAASNSDEMESLLTTAGATPPAKVEADKLKSYVGSYRKDNFQVDVTFEDGSLFAAPGRQEPLRLVALTETTFTPMYLDDFGKITFNIADNKASSCTLHEDSSYAVQLQRISH
ncbi:MAG TPA: VOC family protein [Pyrinomonadaceae bacterium]